MTNQRTYDILIDNLMSELNEAPEDSRLIRSKPLNNNGGEFSSKESWGAVLEAVKAGTVQLAITEEGIWITRFPEWLAARRGQPVLVLKPDHELTLEVERRACKQNYTENTRQDEGSICD